MWFFQLVRAFPEGIGKFKDCGALRQIDRFSFPRDHHIGGSYPFEELDFGKGILRNNLIGIVAVQGTVSCRLQSRARYRRAKAPYQLGSHIF